MSVDFQALTALQFLSLLPHQRVVGLLTMRCSQRRAARVFAIGALVPAWLSFGVRWSKRMMAVGFIVFVIGLTIWLAGEIRLLVVAYRRSLVWFFGCLFAPFAFWLFLAFNAKQAWKPVVIATIGFIVTSLGYWAGGLQILQ